MRSADSGGVRNKLATVAIIAVLSLAACGRASTTTHITPEPFATTTMFEEPSTTALVSTLGVTPEAFFDTWNDIVGAGMPSLVVANTDSIVGTRIDIQFSDILLLEAMKDESTGELTDVSVTSSNTSRQEYDQWQMIAAWAGLIGASNLDLGSDFNEWLEPTFESIGLFESHRSELSRDGIYVNEAMIHNVLYAYEESQEGYTLTARPAP